MKKVFKCDFCNYISDRLIEIENHEKDCALNPNNKYCITCERLIYCNLESRYKGIINFEKNNCAFWILNYNKKEA